MPGASAKAESSPGIEVYMQRLTSAMEAQQQQVETPQPQTERLLTLETGRGS